MKKFLFILLMLTFFPFLLISQTEKQIEDILGQDVQNFWIANEVFLFEVAGMKFSFLREYFTNQPEVAKKGFPR